MAVVDAWMRQPNVYNEHKFLESKGEGEECKKVVPKQTIKEFSRIYDMYNKEKNGLMTISQLRKLLMQAYQYDQIKVD